MPTSSSSIFACAEFSEYDKLFSQSKQQQRDERERRCLWRGLPFRL